MSDQDDPLNKPAPRPDDDDTEPLGTVSAFELTARREHAKNHEGEFEECSEADCVQAREMLEGRKF